MHTLLCRVGVMALVAVALLLSGTRSVQAQTLQVVFRG